MSILDPEPIKRPILDQHTVPVTRPYGSGSDVGGYIDVRRYLAGYALPEGLTYVAHAGVGLLRELRIDFRPGVCPESGPPTPRSGPPRVLGFVIATEDRPALETGIERQRLMRHANEYGNWVAAIRDSRARLNAPDGAVWIRDDGASARCRQLGIPYVPVVDSWATVDRKLQPVILGVLVTARDAQAVTT